MNEKKSSNLYAALSIVSVLGALFFVGHAIFAMSTSIVANTSSSYYSSLTDSVAKSVDASIVFQRHTVLALDIIGLIVCVALFICSETKRPATPKRKKVATPKTTTTSSKASDEEYDDI